MSSRVETFKAMQNLNTPHAPENYPGLLVVRPGPLWQEHIIVPDAGASLVACGGEWAPGFTTPDGGVAQGFRLNPGDRAIKVRADLPWHLAEWRVERAG